MIFRPNEDARAKSATNQRCQSRQSKSPVIPEEPSCPDYPDDFEASSSEDDAEYSDDFDEGEGDVSLKEPMAAKNGVGMNKVGVNMESYSDEEFEQDSDSEVWVRCVVVRCSEVWYGMMRCGVMWFGVV